MSDLTISPAGGGAIAAESVTKTEILNRTRSIWLPASVWLVTEGSPTLTFSSFDDASCWLFDAALLESVATTFIVPEDWSSGSMTVKCYFAMVSATSGNVILHMRELVTADGASITTGGDSSEETTSVPSTAKLLKIYTFTGVVDTPAGAGRLVRMTIRRVGTGAGDTATGDLQFIGMKLEYTADM